MPFKATLCNSCSKYAKIGDAQVCRNFSSCLCASGMTRRPDKVDDRCCHCYMYSDSNVKVRVSQPEKFTRNSCSLL